MNWNNSCAPTMSSPVEVGANEFSSASSPRRQGFYLSFGKPLLDRFASALGLLIASPLLAAAAIAVRLDSAGPVLFRQKRVGREGRLFEIFKFRTMVDRPDRPGLRITASDDARITRVGRWLRKTKLDELPQLFNVLRGDMSLVGPRPEVPEYVAAYDAAQASVLQLRPGITGPASITFLDEEKVLAERQDKESFYLHSLLPQKLALDLRYVENVNFLNDTLLILATLAKLAWKRRRQPAPLPEARLDH